MGVAIQDFPIPATDAMDVTFVLDPTDGISLNGAAITWCVYTMADAVVDISDGPIITKTSVESEITITPSPEIFVVHMLPSDTQGLLGNYYHEARVLDFNGNPATVVKGVMTVTQVAISHL
jgi:hypothetical protein